MTEINQKLITLQWKLNCNYNLYRKIWQKSKSVEWKIIVVDDRWKGLIIDKDFSIFLQ